MAYKFQMGAAILSGALTPSLDNKYDLGTSTVEWKDAFFDGTVTTDALSLEGTVVTATGLELNYLDITTLGTAEASKALTIKGDSTWTVAGMTCANLGAVTTADINAGTVDAVIGGTTPASGSFTGMKADTMEVVSAASGLALIFAGNTAKNKIELTDNLADALNVTQAGNSYMKFTTTNLSEKIVFGKDSTFASTLIDDLGTVATAVIQAGTIDGMTIATSNVTVGADKTLNVSAGTLTLAADQIAAVSVTGLDGNGLADASGVLSLDFSELTAKGKTLVAADYLTIVDSENSSESRKVTMANLGELLAGAGITNTAGVLSVGAATSPNGIADANATLTESFNYATAAITADRTWTLPASNTVGLAFGDVVSVKAATINAGVHIIIARDGSQTIDGSADSIFLDSSYSAVSLKYVAADTWMIF